MKKSLLTIQLCLLSVIGNAQTNVLPKVKKYIEIYAWFKASTPTIDTGEGKGKNTFTTEEGKEIEFHSAIGAVNWFIANGWTLESSHMSTCNDRSVKMYVVSKEISKDNAKEKLEKYIK